jgi:large subunit ribosomal protein L10
MAKELKRIVLREFERRFGDMDGCVLIDYRGLDSAQTVDLRSTLRESGVFMRVVQNRLARRAFSARGDVPPEFEALFKGPTALVFGEDGALSASKLLVRWQKKNQGLAPIKGGLFQGRVLSVEDVGRLSEIPDRPTLQGQLAGLFGAPAQALASPISALLSHFAGAARARQADLEQNASNA